MATERLTRTEVLMGAQVGVMRRIASYLKLRDNNRDPKGDELTWDRDIEGALGELAFCKWADIHWTGSINTFHDPDAGVDIQVRTTKLSSGCLIVRADDKREDKYVLVTGIHPTYQIRGWVYGHEAQKPEFVRDDESWFVPITKLRPLESLSVATKKP